MRSKRVVFFVSSETAHVGRLMSYHKNVSKKTTRSLVQEGKIGDSVVRGAKAVLLRYFACSASSAVRSKFWKKGQIG